MVAKMLGQFTHTLQQEEGKKSGGF